jgi:transposase
MVFPQESGESTSMIEGCGIIPVRGMTMNKKRRTYTREFKLEALRVWQTSDRSGAEIERELGIGSGCFSRWKQKYLSDGESAFPGQGRLPPEEDELQRLRRELEIVCQERDILKKAVAIFSHPRR